MEVKSVKDPREADRDLFVLNEFGQFIHDTHAYL